MPWPLLHLTCCLPSSTDLSPCTHVFRPWILLKCRPIPCCPSMHTQAAASACSIPALLFITRQHPHSESLPTGLVALPAEGKHWSEPNALVGRLTEAAASARQVFDAASQHYADSLERVGSGRSAGTSEEALPDWGAGPQRGQEPPPLKLGKVGWRPTCLSALGLRQRPLWGWAGQKDLGCAIDWSFPLSLFCKVLPAEVMPNNCRPEASLTHSCWYLAIQV